MKRRPSIALVLLVTAVSACWRDHGRLSLEIRDAAGESGQAGHNAARQPSASRTASAGQAGAIGSGSTRDALGSHSTGVAGAAQASDAGLAQPSAPIGEAGADAAVDAPIALDAGAGDRTEVWIGQLWSTNGRGLCDPQQHHDTPYVVQAMGYIDRVVLILEHVGSPRLQGRIQLGEGTLPARAGDVSDNGLTDSSAYWICSVQLPTKGMEYALHDLVLTGDRLMFDISASDVWNAYCGKQNAACSRSPDAGCELSPAAFYQVCTCDDSGCKAAPYNLVAFDLAVTGNTIEGTPPLGGAGTAQLRLRRAQ